MGLTPNQVRCLNCGIVVSVDRDEDGKPSLPGQPCADPGCETILCYAGVCDDLSWICDGCGGRFCNEHRPVEVEDDCTCHNMQGDVADAHGCPVHDPNVKRSPLRFCSVCVEDVDPPIPCLKPIGCSVMLPNIPEFNEVA